jgi:hypothetical protein
MRPFFHSLRLLTKENLEAAALSYNELLADIRYLQYKGKSKNAIHSQVGVVRHYCNYLIGNPRLNIFEADSGSSANLFATMFLSTTCCRSNFRSTDRV